VTLRHERHISRSLAPLLGRLPNGAAIDVNSEGIREALSCLENFIPAILCQVYDEWQWESMDGFLVPVARKTGPGEAEFIGLAILMSDQTVTPIHIRLQVSAAQEQIEWLECKVGEPGDGKGTMERIPYGSSRADKWLKRLTAAGTAPAIDWVYATAFGQKQD
jgi:hypothetical protein